MIVAFFDFDGTISRKDSMLHFIRFTKGKRTLYKALMFHFWKMVGYKLGLISGHRAKESLLSYFFKEIPEEDFRTLGENYAEEQLDSIIFPKAIDRIKWHQAQGHEVVVVTASIDQWIRPWCEKMNIQLIATKIEVTTGKLTGKLNGKNCNGQEKVIRIQQEFDKKQIDYSYGYGNSKGDRPMLAMVNKAFYKRFS